MMMTITLHLTEKDLQEAVKLYAAHNGFVFVSCGFGVDVEDRTESKSVYANVSVKKEIVSAAAGTIWRPEGEDGRYSVTQFKRILSAIQRYFQEVDNFEDRSMLVVVPEEVVEKIREFSNHPG